MALHVYVANEVLTAANLNTSANPYVALKTANETVNNSTTMQNDDELLVNAAISSTYLVELFIMYSSVTQTPDIKFGFTFPAGATFTWAMLGITPTNANQDTGLQAGYARTATVTGSGTRSLGTMASDLTATVTGVFAMSTTAGDLRLQWAQNNATAENTQVLANSFMIATKII